MKKNLFILVILLLSVSVHAQQLRKGINKDSLFNVSIKDLPQDVRDTLTKNYTTAPDHEKEFLLFVVTMPRSSKKLMIKNIDSNYAHIANLKSEFLKLTPKNCKIRIEFEPANSNFGINESIDLTIERTSNGASETFQDWQLQYNSEKLNRLLKIAHWDNSTLKKIKLLLDKANCISIENFSTTQIGFARSGMGEYSYLLFDHNLSNEEAKHYNDGCNQIFYKENIVLEYDGGAAGPQCFPDRD
ncbi:MAG: hypothetical protein JST50_09100 [Bacteroidetes bacterium]|nr:hypothetical protein [Bacteroidota bacterium]